MSLRTLMLAVFGIAIWSAAIATRWQTREIQSQLKMLPLQNLSNSLRGQRDLPEDSDRLALITPARRPIVEVDQQGVRGPADTLWRREYVQIHVPEHQRCELRAFLVETDPDSDAYDPTPIPNADQTVTLPPGVHRLRWDARIDPTGNIIYYGVQLDDQWVIRGQQQRDWAVRPPANSTITSPGKKISAFVQFGGTELMYYGALAYFVPLAAGSKQPTTELHVRVYEVDNSTEQVPSQ